MNPETSVEANYYFWKWADNDLPGRPAEIMAALQRGALPPALQPFDPRRLLSTLRRTASRRPKSEQWRWDVVTPATPERARCVYVTRSSGKEFDDWYLRFWQAFERLGLSGCVEKTGALIPGNPPCSTGGLPPKSNCFSIMQESGWFYDVELADLPGLLRSVDENRRYPWATLENRLGHYVQCEAQGEDKFVVEWAYKQTAGKETVWDHLRARDPGRPTAEEEAARERYVATTRTTAMQRYYLLSADLLRPRRSWTYSVHLCWASRVRPTTCGARFLRSLNIERVGIGQS